MGLCWAQWIHTRFLKPGDSRPSVLGNFLDLFHEWISCSYFHCSPFLKMPLLWIFAFFSNLPARSFALSRKFYLEFVYTCSCLLLALCLFLPVGFTSLLSSLSFTLETSQIPGNSYPLMNKTKKLTGSFVNRKHANFELHFGKVWMGSVGEDLLSMSLGFFSWAGQIV